MPVLDKFKANQESLQGLCKQCIQVKVFYPCKSIDASKVSPANTFARGEPLEVIKISRPYGLWKYSDVSFLDGFVPLRCS